MKTCPKCNRGYDDSWGICIHCNEPLRNGAPDPTKPKPAKPKKMSIGVEFLSVVLFAGAVVILLVSLLFMFPNGTHWGLNWPIAQIVAIIMSIIGIILSVGLYKLKVWALRIYFVVAIINLIWIVIERLLFLNRYVVALTITIADLFRCYGTKLVCKEVRSPVFVNTIVQENITYPFKTTLLPQICVAIFYIITIFYLTRPKVKEQFK